MIIDGTSDKIQFKLGGSITTNQLVFTIDYVNYTSTSATLTTNNGVSNNITAVDLVLSPSVSQQNELRYCSIYNADTVAQTVKILVYNGTTTYQIFQAVLSPNDVMQYQLEKGWEVIDSLGNKKNYALQSFSNTIRSANKNYRPNAQSGVTAPLQQISYTMMGRADKSYANIVLKYEVNVIGSLTLGEMGIFSGKFTSNEIGIWSGKKVGSVDITTALGSTGIKSVTIPVSGIAVGDLIRVGIYLQGASAPIMRSINIIPEISDHSFGSFVGVNNSSKISGINSFYATAVATYCYWIAWQGN